MANSVATRVHKNVASMSDSLRDLYTKVRDKLDHDSWTIVMTRYEIGEMLQEMREDEERYGDAPMAELSAALGIAENTLWHCLKLASTWTREEIGALLERRTARDTRLTFSHLVYLAGVPDEKLRLRLEKATLAEAFTVEELVSEIQTALGTKRSGGRRAPVAPHSPVAGLKQFSKLAANLMNRQEVYETAVYRKLDALEGSLVNDVLLDQLEEAATHAASLEEFAKLSRRKLAVAVQRMRKAGGRTAPLNSSVEQEGQDEETCSEPTSSRRRQLVK